MLRGFHEDLKDSMDAHKRASEQSHAGRASGAGSAAAEPARTAVETPGRAKAAKGSRAKAKAHPSADAKAAEADDAGALRRKHRRKAPSAGIAADDSPQDTASLTKMNETVGKLEAVRNEFVNGETSKECLPDLLALQKESADVIKPFRKAYMRVPDGVAVLAKGRELHACLGSIIKLVQVANQKNKHPKAYAQFLAAAKSVRSITQARGPPWMCQWECEMYVNETVKIPDINEVGNFLFNDAAVSTLAGELRWKSCAVESEQPVFLSNLITLALKAALANDKDADSLAEDLQSPLSTLLKMCIPKADSALELDKLGAFRCASFCINFVAQLPELDEACVRKWNELVDVCADFRTDAAMQAHLSRVVAVRQQPFSQSALKLLAVKASGITRGTLLVNRAYQWGAILIRVKDLEKTTSAWLRTEAPQVEDHYKVLEFSLAELALFAPKWTQFEEDRLAAAQKAPQNPTFIKLLSTIVDGERLEFGNGISPTSEARNFVTIRLVLRSVASDFAAAAMQQQPCWINNPPPFADDSSFLGARLLIGQEFQYDEFSAAVSKTKADSAHMACISKTLEGSAAMFLRSFCDVRMACGLSVDAFRDRALLHSDVRLESATTMEQDNTMLQSLDAMVQCIQKCADLASKAQNIAFQEKGREVINLESLTLNLPSGLPDAAQSAEAWTSEANAMLKLGGRMVGELSKALGSSLAEQLRSSMHAIGGGDFGKEVQNI